MKDKKRVFGIIAAVLAVIAVVAAIVYYRKEIAALFGVIKEKIDARKANFTPEEYEDFADI